AQSLVAGAAQAGARGGYEIFEIKGLLNHSPPAFGNRVRQRGSFGGKASARNEGTQPADHAIRTRQRRLFPGCRWRLRAPAQTPATTIPRGFRARPKAWLGPSKDWLMGLSTGSRLRPPSRG